MDNRFEELLSDTTYIESSVQKLKRAWINETCAPEILPYEEDLVETIRNQLGQQEQSIADASTQENEQFMVNLYKMEVERVKYMLRCYLRVRLSKIEKYYLFLKKDDQEKLKLSEHELKFHQSYHSYFPNVNGAKYYNAVTKHFNESFLQFVPDKLKVEEDIMVLQPNLDSFVFCRVNKQIGEYEVSPESDQTLRLDERDTWLLRYGPVQRLVRDGSLELI